MRTIPPKGWSSGGKPKIKKAILEIVKNNEFMYIAELQRRLRKRKINLTYKGVQYYLENYLKDQVVMKRIGSGKNPVLKLIN